MAGVEYPEVRNPMNWKQLIHRSLRKEEISPNSPAIKDDEWQMFRISLKGLSTSEKYERLLYWLKKHPTEQAKIQVTNYVNALKRGGLVK